MNVPGRAPRLLLAGCAVFFGLCALFVSRTALREDIAAMLPDEGRVAADFDLLRLAPFSRRLVVTVSHPGGDPAVASAVLVGALRAEGVFASVLDGPGGGLGPDFWNRLLDAAPSLLDEEDLRLLDQRLTPERVGAELDRGRALLLGPAGPALKGVLARDPLGICELVLPKLSALTPLGRARIENGSFLSPDGKHALLLVSTDMPGTEALGAERVMAAWRSALKSLPEGAQAMLVGGHVHTEANARAVKRDLRVILPASAALLALIFLFFLRTPRSAYVLLIPVCAVCAAGAATAVVTGGVSGIVLGFGAVLLGISVDFGLHVFFALRHAAQTGGDAVLALKKTARPVIFGALTSGAAFAALGAARIPGIRQLALLSMLGLGVSLLLALFVLPRCLGLSAGLFPCRERSPKPAVRPPGGRSTTLLIVAWLAVLTAGLWAGTRIRLDSDPRSLGYLPETLREDEEKTRRIWGGMREAALIFAHGDTPDLALDANRMVWERLRREHLAGNAASIAPVLPGPQARSRNAARWKDFWETRAARTLSLVESESRKRGFSAAAFAPFAAYLERKPAFATAPLPEDMTSLFMTENASSALVTTFVPDTPELARVFGPETEAGLSARLVSGSRFRAELEHALGSDVRRFTSFSLILVVLLTAVLLRRASRTALALLPAGAGVTAVLLAAQAAGQPLHLFHLAAFPLIMGLSADYGIFMVCGRDADTAETTRRAVFVSGLTTLAGFGVLILARHPALHALGLTVFSGIAVAMLTAVFLLPGLERP